MPRTIYFSGSISGGREDLAHYKRIVGALQSAGHRVFAGTVTSDTVSADGESLHSREIFDRDLGWIEEVAAAGGVLVAEVSRPSIGVGYEIATARYRFGMPVICLWRPAFTRRCSGMIAGDRGIRVIEYNDDRFEAAVAELVQALERE